MNGSTLAVVVALVVVVLLALFMRRGSPTDSAGEPGSIPTSDAQNVDPVSGDGADPDDDDDADDDEVVAVTSDGYALVPDRHAVRMVPPDEEGEAWKAGSHARNRRGDAAMATSWHAGDFTGGRVARGGGEEPWRFEALGRDGEYTRIVFETREAAEAAMALFNSRGVICVLEDEDGNPAPPSAEQFEEARRLYDETEQALAMEMQGEDDEEASS